MKKKIGILYICTGPYCLFWKDFYKSFEHKFLPNYEKIFYVFTDSLKIFGEENSNVKKYNIMNQPWPLITLLRFSTFLSIEEELKKCDYLMFSNANMICNDIIKEEEFLPREEKKEKLFVVSHPGYFKKRIIDVPFERNKKSLAYIPWNCGKNYVIGAMFGGTTDEFIKMSKVLKERIEDDLKKNIIARWHDESHLNRYIIGKKNVRVLLPEYCYPFGMKVNYAKKIYAVSKQDKFDINTFKGNKEKEYSITKKICKKMISILNIKGRCCFIKDVILQKTIKEI